MNVLTSTNSTEVSGGTVADSSGVCIWHHTMGRKRVQQSVLHAKRLSCQRFGGKSLIMAREGSEILQIPDIAEVINSG